MTEKKSIKIFGALEEFLDAWKALKITSVQKAGLLAHVLVAFFISLADYGLLAIVVQFALRKLNGEFSINSSNTMSFLGFNIFDSLNLTSITVLVLFRLLIGYISSRYYYSYLGSLARKEISFIFENSMQMPEDVILRLSQATRKNLVIHGGSTLLLAYFGSIFLVLAESLAVVVLVIALSTMNLSVGLAIIFLITLSLFSYVSLISKSAERNSNLNQKLINDIDDLYVNIAKVRRELRIYNRMHIFKVKFLDLQRQFVRSTSEAFFLSQMPKLIIDGLFFLFLFILIYVSSSIVENPDNSGLAIFTILSLIRLVPGLIKIQSLLIVFVRSKGQLNALVSEFGYLSRLNEGSKGLFKTVLDLEDLSNFHAVQMSDVSFDYESRNLLSTRNLNLSIVKDEFVLLTGDSGVGKTTLINLLLGLLEPNRGVIAIFGNRPADINENIPGFIGYVPQSPQILKNASWLENVALGVPIDNIDVCVVRDLLHEFLGYARETLTSDFLHANVQELSGGELKRLAITRALYLDPKLLVLDEPLGELDPENRKLIKSLLEKLKGKTTVVCVSHDLGIENLADKVLVLTEQGLKIK